MTRDGAVAENLTTGETTSISERPPEENYSAPAAGAAEKATQRISTEVSRHLEKGAEKKSLDAAQLKTHTSRLQFSAEERACLLYTSPSPRDRSVSRMPSSA